MHGSDCAAVMSFNNKMWWRLLFVFYSLTTHCGQFLTLVRLSALKECFYLIQKVLIADCSYYL